MTSPEPIVSSRDDPSVAPRPGVAGAHVRHAAKLRWWLELIYVTIFYELYSAVRNLQGSASVSTARALGNARRVVSLEEDLHVFVEHGWQRAALHFVPLVDVANIFYGTAHFVVTVGALVWLFRRYPRRYLPWRTTLAATTAVALIGFALFPLVPPRLLPAHYGFVDTLARYKTLWSFDSGTMHSISNQYAAMPSLHFAWAIWVAVALFPVLRARLARVLMVAYPVITALVVVITANHYLADLAGGVGALALGLLLSTVGARLKKRPERPDAVWLGGGQA